MSRVSQHETRAWTALACGSLLLAAAGASCSAGEAPPLAMGGAPGPDAPAPASEEPAPSGMGGAEQGTHPLFGAGSYSGVDTSDPCNTAPLWKVDTAIELQTGSVVVHDDKLWELTGESNEAWAMDICTPPGSGWCAEQYLWEEVGTCE